MSNIFKIFLFLLTIPLIFLGIFILAPKKSTQDPMVKTNQNKVAEIKTEATLTPSPAPSPAKMPVVDKYILHKNNVATMFWVGEKATDANDYIPNEKSSWDGNWLEHFGGIDNPYTRDGYFPVGFTPLENPFYYALPYNDLDENGQKESAKNIPWYNSSVGKWGSILKNRWIEIKHKNQVCYGQWEDTGPFEYDDFDYVFGNKRPLEERAGIDLSPAFRHCLQMAGNGYVDWKFVDFEDVPDGPWKEIITTSGVNWQ